MRSGSVGVLIFAATLAVLGLWLPEVAGVALGCSPGGPAAPESRVAAAPAGSPADAGPGPGRTEPAGRGEGPRVPAEFRGPIPVPGRAGGVPGAGAAPSSASGRPDRVASPGPSPSAPPRGVRAGGISPAAPLSLRI